MGLLCVLVTLTRSPQVISLTSARPLSGQSNGNASVTEYSSMYHLFHGIEAQFGAGSFQKKKKNIAERGKERPRITVLFQL